MIEKLQQTADEKEQCLGCYANPNANAQVDLQGMCTQPIREMNACGKSLG